MAAPLTAPLTRRLALFDLDGTLLPGDSDHAFGQFLVQLGWADAQAFTLRNDAFYADYQAQRLNLASYVEFVTQPWRNRPWPQVLAARAQYLANCIEPMIKPQALALVEQHRAAGDLLALVTATNDFVTAPIAQRFGIAHLIATELERDGHGRITGKVTGEPAFRAGKITRVQAWLAGLGLSWGDFERTTFYSDSGNDLALLERVSHPVATNPSAGLAAVAQARGWTVLNLFT